MNDSIRRFEATKQTLAKYRGKVFDWSEGWTCLHAARFHLVKMGHRVQPLPRVKSAIGARRALDQNGWKDVGDMMDGLGFTPIAPAAMYQGDIAFRGSEDGFGALLICAEPMKIIGWFENAPDFVVMDMTFDQLDRAWRV
jgi:hypothetical protein